MPMPNVPIVIDPRALYTEASICPELHISPSTLAKGRKAGNLKFSRQAGATWYLGQWLLDWLLGETKKSQSPDDRRATIEQGFLTGPEIKRLEQIPPLQARGGDFAGG